MERHGPLFETIIRFHFIKSGFSNPSQMLLRTSATIDQGINFFTHKDFEASTASLIVDGQLAQ